MYRIGEFSKITNLTVKALRYYDREGILNPAHRDEDNGYRYYDEGDFKKAQLILILRDLNFSIAEVKDVILNYEDSQDLYFFLNEKKRMIKNVIQEKEQLLSKIDLYVKPNNMEGNLIMYEVTQKNIDPILVLSKRLKGKYSDVSQYFGDMYAAAKGRLKGDPINCYYDNERVEIADIEICLPLSRTVKSSKYEVRELPAIKALSVTHTGPYDKCNLAYKALFDYANKHKLKCLTPSRHVFIKGPGKIFKGNPNKYVTEVLVPIE